MALSVTAPCAAGTLARQCLPSFTFAVQTSHGFEVRRLATDRPRSPNGVFAPHAEASSACTKPCSQIVFKSPSAVWISRRACTLTITSGRSTISLGFMSTISCLAFSRVALQYRRRQPMVSARPNPSIERTAQTLLRSLGLPLISNVRRHIPMLAILAAATVASAPLAVQDTLVSELERRLAAGGVVAVNASLESNSAATLRQLNAQTAACELQAVSLSIRLARGGSAKVVAAHKDALRLALGDCTRFVLALRPLARCRNSAPLLNRGPLCKRSGSYAAASAPLKPTRCSVQASVAKPVVRPTSTNFKTRALALLPGHQPRSVHQSSTCRVKLSLATTENTNAGHRPQSRRCVSTLSRIRTRYRGQCGIANAGHQWPERL